MEGTLSLFDWRPDAGTESRAPGPQRDGVPGAADPAALAEGSGPCARAPAGEPRDVSQARAARAAGDGPNISDTSDTSDISDTSDASEPADKLAGKPRSKTRSRSKAALRSVPASAPEPASDQASRQVQAAHGAPGAPIAPIAPDVAATLELAPALELQVGATPELAPALDLQVAATPELAPAVDLDLDLGRQLQVEAKLEVVATVMTEPRASGVPVAAPGPRIVIFDCETTGTDRLQDQVIELCIQRGLGDDAPSQTWRIKPSVAIHPGAQAVHGISAAELADAPPFARLADEIAAVFAETDVIVGYNIAFDIDMLQAEYTRIGRPLLDLNDKKIVDAFRLWQQCEPRSLQHAHQRFVGAAFASAHSASADVAATGRVLTGMMRTFNLGDHDWEAIACKCDPQYAARAAWVGPSRHLRWEAEVIVLGFGKHSNAPVHQLAAGPDRSFLRWVVERDFPVHVGEVCRAALELPGDEFLAWARRKYPMPPAAAPAS